MIKTKIELKTLDELGYLSRGKSKHRPRNAPELYGGPYPFVQTSDVAHSGLYLSRYDQTYSEAGLAQSKLWPKGTLCITIAANIADTAILAIDACFPDSVIGFIPDETKCDVRFVKYLFDNEVQNRFQQISQGVAQDNLSQQKLLSVKLPIPPLAAQKKIASILSAYDDLIENNRRRMEILEESARLIFKERFEDVWDRGKLPRGWQACYVPDCIEVEPEVANPHCDEIRYIPMAALSTAGMTIDITKAERRAKATSVRFANGDILLAGITPCLENGKTGFVNFLEENEIACGSTEFIVLRGRTVSPYFTYCLSRTERFRETAIKSMVGASGRQRVQPECFDTYEIALPTATILREFDELVELMFDQIGLLVKQNQDLAEARDMLLPKLMRGAEIG